MPSEWQTIAGAAKTLEDELGEAPKIARRFVIDAVQEGLPALWRPENDPKRIERLRLGSGETLRLGAGYDTEATFVLPPPKKRQVGDAEPRPNRGPHRDTHRWGTCLVHAPTVLALAAGTPFEACRARAEDALPEHLREPELPEAAASPPAVERVEIGEPSEAETPDAPPSAEGDDRQRRIDAWMLDYLMGFAARGEKPPKREVAIADCRSVTGATWREAYDARMRAPDYLRGKGGRPKTRD